MKVIFLDFDGVLNSDSYCRALNNGGVMLDPEKMVLLKKIIDATDAKIVLSTSWRHYWSSVKGDCTPTGDYINEVFREHRLEIYDKTSHRAYSRENAIQSWLEYYPEVTHFAVLDDAMLDELGFLKGHFVRTSYFVGLTEEHVTRAIEILNA